MMSERIKELYKQAIVTVPETPHNKSFQWFDPKKFAELIVAHATECVRDVLRDEKSDLTYQAASQVQNRIKQHLGVNE
jgi:hypothetical protein